MSIPGVPTAANAVLSEYSIAQIRDGLEDLSFQLPSSHREASPLSIGQTQASVPELLPEHPVLLQQILDRELLPTSEPAGDRQDHELKRKRNLRHLKIVAVRPGISNSMRGPDRWTELPAEFSDRTA